MRRSKNLVSFIQKPFLGGGMNFLSLDYDISEQPCADVGKWGYLAHVSSDVRKKIMAAGEGEMAAHLEHIKSRVGRLKKLKTKSHKIQLAMDL